MCFQGDLASLRKWLSENRISSDDEIKRGGYLVLESEQLWSLIKDRPEFVENIVQERLRAEAASRTALKRTMVALLVLLAGLALIALSYGLPAVDAASAKSELRIQHDREIAQLREARSLDAKKAEEARLTLARELESAKASGVVAQGENDNLQSLVTTLRTELDVKINDLSNAQRLAQQGEQVDFGNASNAIEATRILQQWLVGKGIRSELEDGGMAIRIKSSGATVVLSGDPVRGMRAYYRYSYKVKTSQEDVSNLLTAIFVVNTIVPDGKLAFADGDQVEFRNSTQLARRTPASIIELFLVDSQTGQRAASMGLKDFLK